MRDKSGRRDRLFIYIVDVEEIIYMRTVMDFSCDSMYNLGIVKMRRVNSQNKCENNYFLKLCVDAFLSKRRIYERVDQIVLSPVCVICQIPFR